MDNHRCLLSQLMNIDEATAMDIFYNSDTMQLINDGAGDLHCHRDFYLAEEMTTISKLTQIY